jgi:hypothetical protein
MGASNNSASLAGGGTNTSMRNDSQSKDSIFLGQALTEMPLLIAME